MSIVGMVIEYNAYAEDSIIFAEFEKQLQIPVLKFIVIGELTDLVKNIQKRRIILTECGKPRTKYCVII